MLWRKGTFCRTVTVCLLLLTPFTASAQDRPLDVRPVLIRANIKTQDLQVVSLPGRQVTLEPDVSGLVVWADGGLDAWQYLAPGSRWTVPTKRLANSVHAQLAVTRGQGGLVVARRSGRVGRSPSP